MNARNFLVLFCAIFLVFFVCDPSFAQPTNLRLRQREIVDIRFEGDSSISAAELQSVIATRTSSWFEYSLNSISSSLGTPRQYIDETVQGYDTIVLQAYYRNSGFLEAKVHYTLHESPESSKQWQKVNDANKLLPLNKRKPLPTISDTVVFHIAEGALYTINLFTFEGTEGLDSELIEKVTKDIGIKHGNKYTRKALAEEIKNIQNILTENGYAFFFVPKNWGLISMDTARKTVNASIVFFPGPRVKNGKARVEYDTTETYRKRGEVHATTILSKVYLDSGQWYRASDLRATEEELYRLGTFEVVRVELDTSAYLNRTDSIVSGTELPITIFVRMRSTIEIIPGLFVGTSAYEGKLVVGLRGSATNKNIFGGAENLTLSGANQFLPTSERRWNGALELATPSFFGVFNIPISYSLGITHSEITGLYLEQTINGQIGTSILLSKGTVPRLTLSPDGVVEYVRRSGVIDTTDQLKRPQFNTLGDVNFTADWTNDFLNPSSGSLASYTFQEAFRGFAGLISTGLPSAAYDKHTIQLKTYYDPTDRGASIFAFRLYGGIINLTYPEDSTRDITYERRFYGGGPNSLRAWPARTLLVSNNPDVNRPGYGGYKAFEANIEWRYALFQGAAISTIEKLLTDLRLAVFIDAGNVWDRTVKPSIKNFAIATGFGIHYNTLFGVIRLDFGFKLYDPDPTVTDNNIHSISPSSEGQWIFKHRFYPEGPGLRSFLGGLGQVFNFEFAIGQSF